MSKIKYHKNCIRHDAVVKTKRMLNKIEKQYGGFQGAFWCDISLTGVTSIDGSEIKSYIRRHLENMNRNIEKQLLRNQKFVNGEENPEYEDYFNISPLSNEMKITEELSQINSFIESNYPVLETKKTDEYILKSDSSEEKFNEAKIHFQNNPVFGFCQEYFAILENGEIRQLFPFTFSHHDLYNAKSIYIEYI